MQPTYLACLQEWELAADVHFVARTTEPNAGYELYHNRLGNLALSPGDRATAAALYGAGPVLSPIVVNTNDTGVGSLREAICYANEHPGTTITFAIPITDPGYNGGIFTIKLTGSLPRLAADGTVIDGASQPDYAGTPVIEVSGEDLIPEAEFVTGLTIHAANCLVRGLAIHGCSGNGIALLHAGFSGVGMWGATTANMIGGTNAASRNVILGNGQYGIWISDSGTATDVIDNASARTAMERRRWRTTSAG